MKNNNIGNYAEHAKYWDWGNLDHDRTTGDDADYNYAKQYGKNILLPMCAWGDLGAYMAKRGMNVTAFDITPEMIAEGKKRFGDIENLNLLVGDIRDFRFDIEPADVCAFADWGHIHSIEEIKKALVCINNHLRDGGYFLHEEYLLGDDNNDESDNEPKLKTFRTENNPYSDKVVYKTSTDWEEASTNRWYCSQTMYIEHNDGRKEQFEHEFYMQFYGRQQWLDALKECGFEVVGEYKNREKEPWTEGDKNWIVEAVKSTADKKRYCPSVSFDYLQTPIYRYENVALYNDFINLEQPNSGWFPHYKFDINADGNWVGGIFVRVGYTIKTKYGGHLGYWIDDENNRNKGYMTKALLALKPFLLKLGFKHVLISNSEENAPSRRVCEKIGAKLLEIVDTPEWHGLYNEQRRTCRWEWSIAEPQSDILLSNLRHIKIDLEKDKDYILERHCRIAYECDCPWATEISYEQYRENWFSWVGQQEGFLGDLVESMKDERTIAEIIKTESGETVGFLWVYFHAEDSKFIRAEVKDIYIEESHRRKGIAEYLMNYAENNVKRNGAKVIRSGTGLKNIKSQRLHEKAGYYKSWFEYEKVLEDNVCRKN